MYYLQICKNTKEIYNARIYWSILRYSCSKKIVKKNVYLLYIRVKIVIKHIQFFRHVIKRFQVHDLFLVREVHYYINRSIVFGFPEEITIYPVHNFSLKNRGNDSITINRIVSFDDFTVIDYIAYSHVQNYNVCRWIITGNHCDNIFFDSQLVPFTCIFFFNININSSLHVC